ncbi:MAG: DUF1761 domain-containing protein [Rhodospirillaceae bacterium]|jgi:hypothetical protein|nr:DUF1761 domain-containing protein [Rhodospirillaceae bacterium]MBT6284770.1 DUF1761 domain-containing protein [Rhodospirillaceae bacterium]
MEFAGTNYIAVVVAAIASFAFGSIYYMVLGRHWRAAIGKTEEQMKADGMKPSVFIVAALAQLVMAWVLSGIIGHLGTDQVTVVNGLISAGFVWVGFVATTLAVNHGFQGARKSLTLIDGGHWLGVLLVQGLVIGLFGV